MVAVFKQQYKCTRMEKDCFHKNGVFFFLLLVYLYPVKSNFEIPLVIIYFNIYMVFTRNKTYIKRKIWDREYKSVTLQPKV